MSIIQTERIPFVNGNNKSAGISRTTAKGFRDLVPNPAFFINKSDLLECKTSKGHSGESWYSLPIKVPDNIEDLRFTLPGFNISSNRWDGISELFFFYLVVDIEITQVSRLLKTATGGIKSLCRDTFETSQTTPMRSINDVIFSIDKTKLSGIKGNDIFLTYGFTDAWEDREFNFQITNPEVRFTTSD